MSPPLEHDYIGLSRPSSMENDKPSISSSKANLNHKETELRLGLPGSVSPDRNPQLGFTLFGKDFEDKVVTSGKNVFVSGAKRGFSDAIDGGFKVGVFVNVGSEANLLCKEVCDGSALNLVKEKKIQDGSESDNGNAPAAKAHVVGWPPIRSFRKNSMATSSTKNNDEAEGKLGAGCLYVKVSMDGAPYLRKVDLNTYTNYSQLSSALAKMFSCFSIGQCGSHGLQGRDGMSESRLMDLLHGSESVLAYEDKDGDWMLVGDVPWQMFANSCRRLRIMKGSEAIGLAPRATDKCKSRN